VQPLERRSSRSIDLNQVADKPASDSLGLLRRLEVEAPKQSRPDQPQMRTRRSRQPCPSQKRWVIQWQGGIGSPTGAST
jgi:hypothetical protein